MEGKDKILLTDIGLRKHGNNWKILESSIPTRNGTQIRSHAQKFFSRIRNELGVDDPLSYVKKNSCDELLLYKFDHYQELEDKFLSQELQLNGNDSKLEGSKRMMNKSDRGSSGECIKGGNSLDSNNNKLSTNTIHYSHTPLNEEEQKFQQEV